jgi:hypothetical protein
VKYGPPEVNKIDSFEYKDLNKKKGEKAVIHSAVSNDIANIVFFADNKNFHQLNIKKKKFKQYKNQNAISMFILDGNYVYTLSHSSEKTK